MKGMLRRIFVLTPLPTVLISLPSFVLVIYVLASPSEPLALSYVAYLLSAYALVISITAIVQRISAVRRRTEALSLVGRLPGAFLWEKLRSNADLRILMGASVNLAYAAMKLVMGLRYHSKWFITMASYYALLAGMRAYLLKGIRRNAREPSAVLELRRQRGIGILLLIMNQALAVMVVMIVWRGEKFAYPGVMIYGVAAYAFYAISMAVVQLIKYRRRGDTLMTSVKVVSLTAAMVSILSLETALLAQFGDPADVIFQRRMTSATGAAVCAVVLLMAVGMIVRSARELRKIKQES